VYSEITLHKSAPGTLNVAVGFHGGFLGTQEISGPGERIVQFSLHDPEGGAPAEILDLGFGAEVKRWPFDIAGLQGHGSHAYVVAPIKEWEPLGLLVTAEKENDGAVVYSAHYYAPPSTAVLGTHQATPAPGEAPSNKPVWTLLARLRQRKPVANGELQGLYSMAYVINGHSCLNPREVELSAPWLLRSDANQTLPNGWMQPAVAEPSCPSGVGVANYCPPQGVDATMLQGKKSAFKLAQGYQITNSMPQPVNSKAAQLHVHRDEVTPTGLLKAELPGWWLDAFVFRNGNDFFCYGKKAMENQTQEVKWQKELVKYEAVNVQLEKPVCLPAGTLAWSTTAPSEFEKGFLPADEVNWYYNEITIKDSAAFTFYMVAGFTGGYFGIQEHAAGVKQAVFSLWDQGEPVSVMKAGRHVAIRRFREELSGMQSIFPLQWKANLTVRFLLHIEDKGGGRKTFSGFIHDPLTHTWQLMARYLTKPCGPGNVATKGYFGGFNSFMEIFNMADCKGRRDAQYGPAWFRTVQKQGVNQSRSLSDDWKPFSSVRLQSTTPAVGLEGLAMPGGGAEMTISGELVDSLHKPSKLLMPQELKMPPVLPEVLKYALPTGDGSPDGTMMQKSSPASPAVQTQQQVGMSQGALKAAVQALIATGQEDPLKMVVSDGEGIPRAVSF
jgi:hypothetical protein